MNSILTPIGELNTSCYHGYDIRFSPVISNLLAVAASENFGIQGCGALLVYDLSRFKPRPFCLQYPGGGLCSLSWNEKHPLSLLTGSVDGSIQTWNIHELQGPAKNLRAHDAEVSSVNWCPCSQDTFASSSWDLTIALWNVSRNTPWSILTHHRQLVYEARWNNSNLLASVAGDGLAVWDPLRSATPFMSIGNGLEVLTCDWSKDDHILGTALSDCSITVWDLRNNSKPLKSIKGHKRPVCKLRFSPVSTHEFISVSYDFTTRIWNLTKAEPQLLCLQEHNEFVFGVDYDRITLSRVADCAFDRTIKVYHIDQNVHANEQFEQVPHADQGVIHSIQEDTEKI